MHESGFRGWLLVLAIFQVLLLFRQGTLVLRIARDFVSGVSGEFSSLAPFSVLYGGRLVVNGLFLALVAVALVLMALRRRLFIPCARLEMTGLMVLPLVEYAWLVVAPWSGRAGFLLGILLLVVIHLSLGLAWRRYIASSQRVAATFVR
jgi:hypothetical protein